MSTSNDAARRAGDGLPFVGTLLWAVTAAVTLWLVRPPAPLDADASPDEAAAGRALDVLERIARDEDGSLSPPRPPGSASNARCRDRILAELRRLGLEPEVQEIFGAYPRQGVMGTARNVVAVLPGDGTRRGGSGRDAILCMAHYDSVFAGPGIGDDLAGVAAWLEVARALASGPALERDVILLFEDGEEQGLLGAELFAEHHPLSARVGAVVNLEGRGNAGPSRMFETGPRNRWAVESFAGESRAPSASSASVEVYRRMPNDTDYTVWRERGVPGLNFAFIGGVTSYHTPLDDIANLSRRSLQHHCTNGLDAVRGLAAAPFPGDPDFEPTGDALFFDVGGRVLARMSVTVARAGSVLTLILAFAAVAALLRRPFVRPGRVLLSVPLLVLAFVLSGAGAHSMRLLVGALGVAPVVHQAHAGPLILACVFAALAAFSLSLVAVGRFVGPSEGLAGALLLLGPLSMALGFSVVGTVHLVALPTVLAAVGVLAAAPVATARAHVAGGLAGLVAANVLWAPLHAAVLQAFGTMPGPVLSLGVPVPVSIPAVPLFVPFLLLAPCLLMAAATPFVTLGALVVAGVAGVLSMQLGSFTPAEPGHVNVVVRTPEEGPSKVYLAGQRPAVERFERGFEGDLVPDRDLGRRLEEPGRVEILERGTRAGGWPFVRVRVTPREGCDLMQLFPTGANSVMVDGVAAPGGSFRLLAPSPDGHEMVFESGPGDVPFLAITEVRSGLWHGAVRGAVEPWITARPDDTVSRGMGDRSEVASSWTLDGALEDGGGR